MSEASPSTPAETEEQKRKVEEEVASRPVEEPPPEIKPAPNPDVALEPPHQEVATVPRQEPRTPAPATTAPQAIPELTPRISDAVPTWKSHILALLERHKRYPEAAQSRHQQGIAQVLFSLDRLGRVTRSRIVHSSGASALDEEALALLQRAQPFPPPPPDVPGEHVELSVPIRFNLK
jgi:protein TonB